MYDLIIKNGKLIDGTGKPAYNADIAISGGKILKVYEHITDTAKDVIDATDRMYAENWGKVNHTLRMIQKANGEGYDIYCDCYPYNASHTGILPTIIDQDIRAMYPGRMIDSLSDSALRRT